MRRSSANYARSQQHKFQHLFVRSFADRTKYDNESESLNFGKKIISVELPKYDNDWYLSLACGERVREM